MWEAIQEVVGNVHGFVTSADFQAFLTATIGIVTTFALLQNKVAALKVAKSENIMLKHNVELVNLEHTIEDQGKVIKQLSDKLEVQSNMFSLAFLNSKKLDATTKQELARLSKLLNAKEISETDKGSNVIESVIKVVEQVADKKDVVEKVLSQTSSIFENICIVEVHSLEVCISFAEISSKYLFIVLRKMLLLR